jgi:tRNA U34 2-thiouridine synthase MnmA/TrmU
MSGGVDSSMAAVLLKEKAKSFVVYLISRAIKYGASS